MTSIAPATCWALSDGAAGNARQAAALAEALGGDVRVVRLDVREPWASLAPRLLVGARWAIRDSHGETLSPPWPDIAIGCGRRAALATRALRTWSGDWTFTVQILDPRIDPRAFDVVVAPRHDCVRGDNVIHSIGALNPIDAAWLRAGRDAFPAIGALPAPRTAVLVGATNAAQRIDASYIDVLLQRLAVWNARDGGSFLVSASRRTPPEIAARLRSAFAKWPGLFWAGNDDGPNPYAGLLGWADRFVVTPDSVNMLSEASATGNPVYTFAPRAVAGKFAAFHEEMRANGYLRSFDAIPERPQRSLAETREIADLVRERYVRHAAECRSKKS